MSDPNHLIPILTPDDVINCTLTSEAGKVYYTVTPEHTDSYTFTHVSNAQDELIASLEWMPGSLPDRVILGHDKSISIVEWMKKSSIPFEHEVSFTDSSNRVYKWKGFGKNESPELYTKDDHDNSSQLIAYFHKPLSVPPNPESSSHTTLGEITSSSKLILEKQVSDLGVQDLVVTSFLFLEKNQRISNESSGNSNILAATVNALFISTGAGAV